MSILITGGAGFIGSHLIHHLRGETSARIVCLDNFNDYYDPQLKRANAAKAAQLKDVEIVEGDFRDYEFDAKLFREHQFEHVIHLGAYAGVRASVQHARIYQETNVGGTLALLEAARQFPVQRFVLASSSTVYGTGAAIPFTEDAALGIPASPYGVSKRAAELLALNYHGLHGVPALCLRPFSVYGPGLRPDLALTIFTAAIENGDALPLFGDGTIRRDFTHVSDICAGIMSSLSAADVVGETINLGQSEPVEMREIIRLIEEALGKQANIHHMPERSEDLPVTFANLDKAKYLLGYEPRVTIQDGIREFCQWYRSWHGR